MRGRSPWIWRAGLALAFVASLTTSSFVPVRGDEEPASKSEALGPSWRAQAEEAYGRKAWADAVYHYRRWLEADPTDRTSWYNLACCYALDGHPERALDSFEMAVRAGWRDTAHPLQDPDLASVREEPRFLAALERASTASSEDGPRAATRHWLRIQTLGTYLALLPPEYATSDRSYPLVVILHGAGSSELGHGRLADRVGRDDVIWIVPRAPYPYFEVFASTGAPGWVWRPQGATNEEIEDFDPAAMYVDTVLTAVADARTRYRIAGDRFHVLGHSMGAFFANTLAALHPERVSSFFAYAGGLSEDVATEARLAAMKSAGLSAWLVHGTADVVVEPAMSRQAYERLHAAGVDVHLELVDDVDHRVQPAIAELMTRWLKEVVLK